MAISLIALEDENFNYNMFNPQCNMYTRVGVNIFGIIGKRLHEYTDVLMSRCRRTKFSMLKSRIRIFFYDCITTRLICRLGIKCNEIFILWLMAEMGETSVFFKYKLNLLNICQ